MIHEHPPLSLLGQKGYPEAVRLLFLSDIHANKPALDAVLEQARAQFGHFDSIYCLGDVVGYGPHPREVLEELYHLRAQCILGNHELGLLGLIDGSVRPTVGTGSQVLLWQMKKLSDREIKLLRTWNDIIEVPEIGARLRHGTPLSGSDYLELESARQSFQQWDGNLSFVGHTHVPAVYATLMGTRGEWMRHEPLSGEGASKRVYLLPPAARMIINVGSVGQPRDGDPRASYGVFDTEKRRLEVHRVPYDIARVQHDLRAAGLPESLAERLAHGR